MPSTPRGRDAATLLAVIVAIVLALAWLRSSESGAPVVPTGLSVETVPAVALEERVAPVRAAPPPAKPVMGEDARPRVGDPGARLRGRVRIRQDPPATAPAPPAGRWSGTPQAAPPEFALE